jgi:hypothetical protein
MMRLWLALVVLVLGLSCAVADAQTVFTRQGGRVIAVPLADLPTTPPSSTPVVAEGGTVRVDGLPAGALVAVDGRALGGPGGLAGGWIVLPPGPHFIDVTLPGGQAIRFTVVTPTESSGYQVVPKP